MLDNIAFRIFNMQLLLDELVVYLSYIRNLHFFDAPNYEYLWGLFHSFMRNNGWKTDWKFDWDIKHIVVTWATYSSVSSCRRCIIVTNKHHEGCI